MSGSIAHILWHLCTMYLDAGLDKPIYYTFSQSLQEKSLKKHGTTLHMILTRSEDRKHFSIAIFCLKI